MGLDGIYAGFFTPTESVAVGALGSLLMALGKRWLNASRLWTVPAVEIGLPTPPFGIAAFMVKATLEDQGITLNDAFAGIFRRC